MDSIATLESSLLTALSDRRDQAPPFEHTPHFSRIDASLLSSAWQKAIRRGDAFLATRCALELQRRNPCHVWRRIRIIALEDISVGDTELVATVLAIAGKKVLHRAWGERRLLSLLVTQMANAPKSRTACDLACALPLEYIADSGDSVHVDLSTFDAPTLIDLASRWRNTASYAAQIAGSWRTISHGNRTLRDHYLDEIEAPPLVRFIATRGSGTEALNSLLVIAHQLKERQCELPRTLPQTPSSWQLVNGLPAYSYCMYSAPGMQALKYFLKHTRWGTRLRELEVRQPVKALGHLVFYAEGGHLSRPMQVCHAEAIRQWSEAVSLGRFGITADQIETLKADVRADLPQLNACRRQVTTES